VRNAKLLGHALGAFAVPAGDGHDFGTLAILKARNLGRASKARADDADANCFSVSQFLSV
jgi:hypothetical protein